jgi:hypothetical protein
MVFLAVLILFNPFSIFSQFWLFLARKGKKCQNRKEKKLLNLLLLRSIYIPNFSKFYQAVWILEIFFIFGLFWLFFGKKKGQQMPKLQGMYIPNFRKFH